MRLIDADAYAAEMAKRQDACGKWMDSAIDELTLQRAEGAYTMLCEAKLTLDEMPTIPAPRWHRVEDNPPTPGCYLTSSPFFHGDDYSWLYRLAWWTEHGLMDFVQDAEKESGWYIWNNSQDRDTEIEPMYWMPIEPPKEDA